jgi:hypothetical protein
MKCVTPKYKSYKRATDTTSLWDIPEDKYEVEVAGMLVYLCIDFPHMSDVFPK